MIRHRNRPFCFSSVDVFVVSYSGKNVDTPTSPLYTAKKITRTKASSRIVDLVTTNKLKHGLPLHRIIQRMVNEDYKRFSTNHVHGKTFPVTSNKFKWVILIQRFAKNSLNAKKEKS